MKTYLTFIILLMLGFTGYFFINRPGHSLNFSLISSDPPSTPNQSPLTFPYFVYISGDVLVSSRGETYRGENEIALETGDSLFVSARSRAILKLGEEQLLLLNEGTKLELTKKLKRDRGMTEFFLKRGTVLVDFFKSKKPVGIKINTPFGYTFSQDATFRLSMTSNDVQIANDRNPILLIHTNGKDEKQIKQGVGGVFNSMGIETGKYKWVDDYPWEAQLNSLSLRGYGRKGLMKAPMLGTRIQTISKTETFSQVKPRKRKVIKKEKSSFSLGSVVNKVKEKAQNLGSVGNKIKESQQAIEEFKKKQEQNQEVIENL